MYTLKVSGKPFVASAVAGKFYVTNKTTKAEYLQRGFMCLLTILYPASYRFCLNFADFWQGPIIIVMQICLTFKLYGNEMAADMHQADCNALILVSL